MKPTNHSDKLYRVLGVSSLVLTFGVFGAWAGLAPLKSAVVTQGKISLTTQNQSVQHIDGGLVDTLLVRDGDQVAAGQPLLTLNTEELEIRRDQLRAQLFDADARFARLEAERTEQAELLFSDATRAAALEGGWSRMLETQQQLFESRRQTTESDQEAMKQRIAQTDKQMQAAEQQIESLKQRIASMNEDLRGVRKLAKKQLAPKAKVREVERTIAELEAQVVAHHSDIARLMDVQSESAFRLSASRTQFISQVVSEQQQVQAMRIELQSNMQSIKERIERSIVRAPLSGKVKGLILTTIGAVVQPGDTLMEIVPSADAIEIIARISPTDIDVVQVGMTAETRFSALDGAQDMPTLFATLTDASTDVFEDERGQGSYYTAKLEVNPEAISYLKQGDQQLVSGMPVDVMITTGERTLLQYLLSPLTDTFNKAFNEA